MRLQGKVWLPLMLAALASAYWWQSDYATQPVAEGAFAPSLRQTSVDGLPVQAVSGSMDVKQLKALFDYYLSTQGERSLDEIRQEVSRQLNSRLSGKALADAMDFFDRYLAYLADLGAVGKQHIAGSDVVAQMRLRLQLQQQLRARHFSRQEIALLFGSGDVLDEHILQRLAILQRGDLSPADKQRQLAQLEQSLPPAQRAARQQAMQHLLLADAEQTLRQQGGSGAQLQALRTSMVGAEAAQRLAAVDAEQVAWQARVQQWQQAKVQLGKDMAMSDLQRQQALQALEHKLFSENERKRLAAYP